MPQSNYINQPTPPPKILAVVKPARGNELLRESNANGKPSYPKVGSYRLMKGRDQRYALKLSGDYSLRLQAQ